MQSLSNERLLEEYKNSSLAAFKEFYRRHHRLIYAYLQQRLRNPADTDDALQETFSRIHRYILNYDPQQNAMGWVFSIAKNVSIDIFKKRVRLAIDPADVETLADKDSDDFVYAAVEEILATLNEKERQLIKAKFLEEESYEALSDRLNTSQESIRQRISRIIKKMRTQA